MHLLLNKRSQRKVIEQVGESFPHIRVAVFTEALVVEAIHLRDLATLVIACVQGTTTPR